MSLSLSCSPFLSSLLLLCYFLLSYSFTYSTLLLYLPNPCPYPLIVSPYHPTILLPSYPPIILYPVSHLLPPAPTTHPLPRLLYLLAYPTDTYWLTPPPIIYPPIPYQLIIIVIIRLQLSAHQCRHHQHNRPKRQPIDLPPTPARPSNVEQPPVSPITYQLTHHRPPAYLFCTQTYS